MHNNSNPLTWQTMEAQIYLSLSLSPQAKKPFLTPTILRIVTQQSDNKAFGKSCNLVRIYFSTPSTVTTVCKKKERNGSAMN